MRTHLEPKTVIFDLDGTIIDSEGTALKVAKSILPKYMGGSVSEHDLNYLKGKPWIYVLKEWFPGKEQEIYNSLLEEWDRLNPKITAYDGIVETISSLRNLGIRMCIASSKEREYIIKDLEELAIGSYFDAIVGQGDTSRHKPAPDPLILAAKKMEVSPSECIYIGDQPSDIMASRSAGMISGGALWGEGVFEILASSRPDYMFRTPDEILSSIFHV